MNTRAPAISRRALLRTTAVATTGLVLGFHLPVDAADTANAFQPNAWIRIAADGAVEFLVSKTEMGQGTLTGMAMILAEELDADWARVSVRTVVPDGVRFMSTGGSYSISGAWEQGRVAAAAAREMLLQAGAAALGVAPAHCHTAAHAVVHGASGRSIGYGELVTRAAALEPPAQPRLKDPARFSLVGRSLPAVHLDAIVRAQARYGIDVRVPGMLFAVVERSPVVNGGIASLDDRAACAMPGVEQVVRIRGTRFPAFNYVREGVAVVATSTWAALQARAKLRIEWTGEREGGLPQAGSLASSTRLRADFERALAGAEPAPAEGLQAEAIALRTGTPESLQAAFAAAAHTLELDYEVPLQAHAPLEPMNATVHWTDARCEAWVPCHFQSRLLDALMELTGLPAAQIVIHTTLIGGSFGRRLDVDYALEAAQVSRASGRPVQLVWTREDDMRFGLYGPPSRHRVRMALDDTGAILGMDHAFAALSVWKQQEPQELEASGLDYAAAVDAIKFPYAVGSRVVRHRLLEQTIRVFWWRRGYTPNHTFANECALDECAHAVGVDPLAYRLRLLGEPRRLEFDNKGSVELIDTGRLAGVLRRAAAAADWERPPGAGRGRGIASTVTDTSVAVVVEVMVRDATIKVERVIVAVDCGIVINPQLAAAQVEGSVAFALTAALKNAITVEDGQVQQGNFDDYPLLGIHEMPPVEVLFMPSAEAPSGTGEQISHPIAAALSNAVFAATGRRLRSLPFRLA